MTPRIAAALAMCLALVSCERASKLVEKAKETVANKAQKTGDGAASADVGEAVPMDPELAKRIDQTEEGIVFRRDLPFPKSVEVRITEKEPIAVRMLQQSEVGTQSTTISSVRHMGMTVARTSGTVRFSEFKEEYFDAKPAAGDGAPSPIRNHPLLPPTPPKDHTMVFRGGKWSAMEHSGFAEVALAQQLGPQMPSLFQEYGLNPRSMWFGKRRIAPGKPMQISGELLPMLIAGNATGELTITLEEIESVHGHPCGRFAVKGSYARKSFPFPDGRLFHEESTIQSGHIWMSVLHPLVLQYRVERIVTLTVAEGSGPSIRFQGNTSLLRSIAWKPGAE